MRFTSENTVLLVIDVQEKLFNHIDGFNDLQIKIPKIIEGMRILEIPTLVTEQYPKGLGYTIDTVKLSLGGNYNPIIKSEFSCIDCSNFLVQLKELDRGNVVIVGIEAHVCVLQTVIDLFKESFRPIVVADCIGSRNSYDKKIAMRRMEKEGAYLTTFESILFELMRNSAHSDFKKISNLIK